MQRESAAPSFGLNGTEDENYLMAQMAEHPTLLQRPIAVLGDKAAWGRPVERILEVLA